MNDETEEAEEQDRRTRVNLVAAIVILLLLIGSFWLFTSLNAQQKLELCLEAGRRDCAPAAP
jgi:heme/copper-type cytochrome/quinol oxidase subunit 4